LKDEDVPGALFKRVKEREDAGFGFKTSNEYMMKMAI
jgi:hypothetical protein